MDDGFRAPLGRAWRWSIAVGSACAFFGATLAAAFALEELSGRKSDRSALMKEALARQAEEHPRPSPAPASTSHVSLAELEALGAEARNLREMLAHGDGEWLQTVLHLSSYAFVADRRLACASAHGRDIDVCFSRMITVVEPADAEAGVIVHAHAELVDPSEGPSPSSRNHPDCEQYVACVAKARIGETIPIPGEERSVFALEELYQLDAIRPDLLDVDKVRAMISQFDEALAMLETQPTSTIEDEYKRASVRGHATYLRRHLQRLESLE